MRFAFDVVPGVQLKPLQAANLWGMGLIVAGAPGASWETKTMDRFRINWLFPRVPRRPCRVIGQSQIEYMARPAAWPVEPDTSSADQDWAQRYVETRGASGSDLDGFG